MINSRKAMENLFVSRVRIKLLKFFMMNPDVPVHLRGAVREMKEEINAVRRELMRLEEIKLLKTDTRGNRKYYVLNKQGPFVEELRGIVFKTFGLGGELLRNMSKLGDIKFGILTGAYLTGIDTASHPVDLVLIGDVNTDEMNKLIASFEQKEQREINYTVFSLNEFELRKKRKDNFVIELLLGPKLMLMGTHEELIS